MFIAQRLRGNTWIDFKKHKTLDKARETAWSQKAFYDRISRVIVRKEIELVRYDRKLQQRYKKEQGEQYGI